MRHLSIVCDGVEFKDKAPVIGGQALVPHSRGYIRGTYMGHDASHHILTNCTVYSDVGKGLERMETCRRAWSSLRDIIRAP